MSSEAPGAMHRATLRLAFADAAQAERLRASVAADDDGHLALRREGATLVVEASAPTPLGLLRGLDELVAQLAAAEKAERLAR